MESDYPILKISIIILKVFSYILIGLAVLGALVIFFGKTPGSGKLASIGILIAGGFWSFILFLVSELIRLFLDLNRRFLKIENSLQTPKREIR